MNRPNYTQISNDFLDNEMQRMSGAAIKIFLIVSRKTIGWHKDTDPISYSQIMEYTGIRSKTTVSAALSALVSLGLIIAVKKQGKTTVYEINMVGTESEQVTSPESVLEVSRNCTGSSPETVHTKERRKETTQKKDESGAVVDEVFEFFRQKTNSHVRSTTQSLRSCIQARIDDGYTLDDCKKAIMFSYASKKDNPEQRQYIRIDTIFRPSKFSGYLDAWHREVTDGE